MDSVNRDKALYEADGRENLYAIEKLGFEEPSIEIIQSQALSIACLMDKSFLNKTDTGYAWAKTTTLSNTRASVRSYCQSGYIPSVLGEGVRFSQEPAPGFGTAFLIGKQFVFTSAHCICAKESPILSIKAIRATRLVFGFKMEDEHQAVTHFSRNDVYKIKTVIAHQYSRVGLWEDWALLELDREVSGRSPINIHSKIKAVRQASLYMLGHPMGLPLKITGGGGVKKSKDNYFECALSGFKGNSGSPVFDKDHQLVGIFCTGNDDYEWTKSESNGKKIIREYRVKEGDGYERCQAIFSLLSVQNFILQQSLLNGNQETDWEKEIVALSFSLRERYKRMPRRLLDNQPCKIYETELVLPQDIKKNGEKEQETENQAGILSEDIPISLENVFEISEQNHAKGHVFILAQAGMGKSTLCRHIAYRWSQENLWKDKFDLLFVVPMRDIQDARENESLGSILSRLCYEGWIRNKNLPSSIDRYIEKNSDRILFILDGLDECDLNNPLLKRILNSFLTYPNWIASSRFNCSQYIPKAILIENRGFSRSTIASYIKDVCPKSAMDMIRKIVQNQNLLKLCQTPLFLEQICSVGQNNILSLNSKTIIYTRSHEHMFSLFLQRFNIKHCEEAYASEEIQKVFEFLEKVALIGLKNRHMYFSFESGELKDCYQALRSTFRTSQDENKFFTFFDHSGYIQTSNASKKHQEKHRMFLHSTFQEFFAARYLVRLLKEKDTQKEALRLLREVQFNIRYQTVIVFVSGLLNLETAVSRLKNDPELLSQFFENLESDAIGLYSILLRVRCLEECEWTYKIKNFDHITDIKFWCSQIFCFNGVWEWIKTEIMETFCECPQGANRILLPILNACLLAPSPWQKEESYRCLSKIREGPIKKVSPPRKSSSKDPNKWDHVQIPQEIQEKNAKEALMKIATILHENYGSDKILTIDTLDQKNLYKALHKSGIEFEVFQSLGKIGRVYPKIILSMLEKKILKERQEDFRWIMLGILEKYGLIDVKTALSLREKKNSHRHIEVLNALIKLEKVIKKIENEKQCDSTIFNEILGQISHLKNQTNQDKRIAEVLDEIGSVHPTRVIHLLPYLLRSPDGYAVRQVIVTLGKVGKTSPKYVIPYLAAFLQHPDHLLRSLAAEALGKVGPKEPQSALPFLTKLLHKDKYLGCRREIAKSLKRFDLSHYPEIVYALFKNGYSLSSTPFDSLMKQYLDGPKEHFNYLLAIVSKCIAENRMIFYEDDSLYYTEKEVLYQFPKIHDAKQRLREIEKMTVQFLGITGVKKESVEIQQLRKNLPDNQQIIPRDHPISQEKLPLPFCFEYTMRKKFHEQAEKMIQEIRQNALCYNLCDEEDYFELICYLLKTPSFDFSKISSLTSFYQEVTNKLMNGGDKENVKIFHFCEILAWEGLKLGKKVFTLEEVIETYNQHNDTICIEREKFMSEISQTCLLNKNFSDQFHFFHPYLQDFLSARYLKKLFDNERSLALQLIEEIKFDGRYIEVISCLVGLLKENEQDLNDLFFILDMFKDTIGVYSTLLKMRCIEETGNMERLKGYSTSTNIWLWYEKLFCSSLPTKTEQSMIQIFRKCPQVCQYLLLPDLISQLSNAQPRIRERAVEILGRLGIATASVLDHLIGIYENEPNGDVRGQMILSIMDLSKVMPSKSLLWLAQCAENEKENGVLHSIFIGLYSLGDPKLAMQLIDIILKKNPSKNDEAGPFKTMQAFRMRFLDILAEDEPLLCMPLLLDALKDKNSVVNGQAWSALKRIASVDPETVMSICLSEFSIKDRFSAEAALAFGSLGRTHLPLILPKLKEVARSQDVHVRSCAALALGEIGLENFQVALPLLTQLLHDRSSCFVREKVAIALRNIGQADPYITCRLILEVLQDEEEQVSMELIRTLGELGYIGPKVILPLIANALNSEDSDTVRTATEALSSLRRENLHHAVPLLLKLLSHSEYIVRLIGIDFLDQLQPEDVEFALPLIKQALQDNEDIVKWKALTSLGLLGKNNPNILFPLLLEAMKDQSLRPNAIRVLAKFDLSQMKKEDLQYLLMSKRTEPLFTSTPLLALLTNCKMDMSQPSIYSYAIISKCIEECKALFWQDNNLCFYEGESLHHLEFPNFLFFIQEIYETASRYPLLNFSIKREKGLESNSFLNCCII